MMLSRRILTGSRLANMLGVIIGIVFMLPLIWLLFTAIAPAHFMGQYPPSLWPRAVTAQNFIDAFRAYHFQEYLAGSLIVTLISTILVVGLGSPAAYALARTHMRGKLPILVALLLVSTFPAMAVVMPLYAIFRRFEQLNTYQCLIIPYVALNLPFAIWLLRSYYHDVPFEIEEAGQIDGASPMIIATRLILPQVIPGTCVAGVLTFVACWQEFLLSLSFNTQPGHQTIPVGIAGMTSYSGVPFPIVFSASLIALVPVIVMVVMIRKWMVQGAFQGGVKG